MSQSELTLIDSLARLRLAKKKKGQSPRGGAPSNSHATRITRSARQSAQSSVSSARDARDIKREARDAPLRASSPAQPQPSMHHDPDHPYHCPDPREDALDAIEETLRNLHAFADWLAESAH